VRDVRRGVAVMVSPFRPMAGVGRPSRRDVLISAAVTFLTLMGTGGANAHRMSYGSGQLHATVPRAMNPFGWCLLLIACVALAWRRSRPNVVLLIAVACSVTFERFNFPIGPVYLAEIVAFVNAVALARDRVDRTFCYTLLTLGYLLSVRPGFGSVSLTWSLLVAGWMMLLAALAELVRSIGRARRASADARRAEQRRRAGEERLRIAQDLHDVLAHQLALITVQANAGLALLDRDPERVAASLRAIKDAGNTGLAELRHVLDALRTPDGSAPRRPAPLLSRSSDLAGLMDGAQAAGLRVRREVSGTERALPIAVDQAGYRIVQEALTNAVRHAGSGTGVLLRLDYRPDTLLLTVDDDGRGVPTPGAGAGGGNGLPGMGERVDARGGVLTAGAKPGGGWLVTAVLPTGGDGRGDGREDGRDNNRDGADDRMRDRHDSDDETRERS
jgi:signal transduction histidine kinase